MAIKFTNIVFITYEALRNFPKVGFLVSKYTYHLATLAGLVGIWSHVAHVLD
jgi:hypothetical protein